MYTECISGNLFGLIPITFDPEHPPPLNIPLIYFTDVKVHPGRPVRREPDVPGLQSTSTHRTELPPGRTTLREPHDAPRAPPWIAGCAPSVRLRGVQRAARQSRSPPPRWCTRTMLVVPGTPGGEPAVMIMVSPSL